MTDETLRYDIWVEEALRSVIKKTLSHVSKHGLPGDHHFYISFMTQDEGVDISGHIRAQHPNDMTIVLQHQFDDLDVNDDFFSVSLSFGGKKEFLKIPYTSVVSFADPSVNFALQLKMLDIEEEFEDEDGEIMEFNEFPNGSIESLDTLFNEPVPQSADQKNGDGDDEPKTGEVITLDAFRKK